MKRLFSVPEVAERFDVTNQTVRNWIAGGRLRAIQATPRGRHRIPAEALDAFERQAVPARSRSATSASADPNSSPLERRNMPGTRMADAELARIVGAIVASLHPDAVVLFGSRARGDFRADSDFDLAVVAPDGSERRHVAMRAYEAIARIEGRTIGVDLVVLTPRIISANRDLVGSVARAVVQEGVPVYGSIAFA